MSSGRSKALLQCCFAALAFAGLHALAESVSVGTKLEIRLQQPISSYATEKGTRISGVLVAPLTEGGEMLLPLGTTVEGSVVAVRKVGLGVVHETARLRATVRPRGARRRGERSFAMPDCRSGERPRDCGCARPHSGHPLDRYVEQSCLGCCRQPCLWRSDRGHLYHGCLGIGSSIFRA